MAKLVETYVGEPIQYSDEFMPGDEGYPENIYEDTAGTVMYPCNRAGHTLRERSIHARRALERGTHGKVLVVNLPLLDYLPVLIARRGPIEYRG